MVDIGDLRKIGPREIKHFYSNVWRDCHLSIIIDHQGFFLSLLIGNA